VAADLLDAAIGVPRDADTAVAANGDEIQRRLDAAAPDELGDERGEALLLVRCHPHAGTIADSGLTAPGFCGLLSTVPIGSLPCLYFPIPGRIDKANLFYILEDTDT
jgi:hypothetical protein